MDRLTIDEPDWRDACAGDGAAFGRIFDRYADRIARHVTRLVPAPADVEDVVAVTFLEAWRRRAGVRLVNGSLLPWLLVTATNSARNFARSARRHRALLQRLEAVPVPVDLDAGDLGPTETALRSLSVSDQQLITLCDLYGYSSAEAAVVLAISGKAVRSRLSRARQRLARAANQPIGHGPMEGEIA